MKVTPVHKYPVPRFPTAAQAALDPALLAHCPSRRLLGRAGVSAALLILLSAATGCGEASVRTAGAPTPMPPPSDEELVRTAGTPTPLPSALNEEDVLSILRNEAALLGITFDDTPAAFTAGDATLEADLPAEGGKLAVAALYSGEDPGPMPEGEGAPTLPLGSVARLTDSEGKTVDTLVLTPINEGQEEEVRESFRQFIDWLKAEGVL